MTQTLYAFLALMIVTMLSLSQRSSILQAQLGAMRSDIDLVGAGVAVEQLDYIGTRPFDANLPVTSPTLLTLPSDFGSGSATYHGSSDIDDFHNKTLAVSVPTAEDTLYFSVLVHVGYVTKSGANFAPSGTPTYFKQVTVSIAGEVSSTVRLSRIFAYH